MSEDAKPSVGDVTVQVIKSVAEITIEVAGYVPVPGLAPAATLVLTIISLCGDISVNKKEAEYLARRCAALLPILRDGTRGVPQSTVTTYSDTVCQTLEKIQKNFKAWTQLDILDRILMRADISDKITESHRDIDLCLHNLLVAAALATNKWQQEAEKSRKADHVEVLNNIHDLLNGQFTTAREVNELLEENRESHAQWVQLMGLLQERLQLLPETNTRERNGLQQMLANVEVGTGGLPPGTHISGNGREVRRVNQHPTKIGYHYDIYEGEYLGVLKVALKVLRGIKSEQKHFKRFLDEAKIWREVWEVDQGTYILPYIGTVSDDGPYPYMVSPWQSNGTAIAWVNRTDVQVDRVKLIKGFANGLQFLHTWKANGIVHGDIRGDNILISDEGNPRISDFSLSKILEEMTGVPRTQSLGISESYRWFAPEVCGEESILSTQSDMFSFGMTVLELMTGKMPFADVKSNTKVLFLIQNKERPSRPQGLSDDIWSLITKCWPDAPQERLTIQQAVALLG